MTDGATDARSFLARFSELERQLSDHGPSWLRELRLSGRQRFEQLGLPTPRLEEWKNTSVAPIVGTPFAPPQHNGSAAVEPGR